jgi:two-component system, OmpR family, sensor kinase
MQAKTHAPGRAKRQFHFFSSLRFRLMLWYLLILGIVLCAFSTAIYVLEEYTLYQSLDTLLTTTMVPVASSYDPQTGQVVETNASVLVILQNPQGQITQVNPAVSPSALPVLRFSLSHLTGWGNSLPWHNSGSSFLSTSPHGQTLLFTSTGETFLSQTDLGGGSYYAVKRFTITTRQNQLLSLLYIGVPSGDIPDQLGQLLITLVVATPLVLLFSSVGGYWLASRATRPVQTITRTAQAISATDLHRRLNLRQRDEMGELATTFDHMLDRLEGAFERQQQFTADASHELRTPLSIVNTEVERVLQRPHTSQEYVQALSIIQQENQRMTQLVTGLLTLARADKGQTRLNREQIDLSEIVVDAAEQLACLAEQNGIEIHLSDLDELFVCGDRLYLTQLCTNLLENAIKYSTGLGKRVDIRLDRQQEQARIQIIDEGPGIEASHLPHIFERFYRVDQSRTHTQSTGSGLGLSIARWIAQEHGGSIQVQSTPGQGSIFAVCLPLQQTCR